MYILVYKICAISQEAWKHRKKAALLITAKLSKMRCGEVQKAENAKTPSKETFL